jgi:hypothetical protein
VLYRRTCLHSLFWPCSWTRQNMGITIALKPSVTSGVPNTLYVEFSVQRRQTNVSQTMRPTLNSESNLTPFHVLHVALPSRDDVCQFTFLQSSQGHLALCVWSCDFFSFHRVWKGQVGQVTVFPFHLFWSA